MIKLRLLNFYIKGDYNEKIDCTTTCIMCNCMYFYKRMFQTSREN